MSHRAHVDHNLPAFRRAHDNLAVRGYTICAPDELSRNRESIEAHGTPGGIDALRADANICMHPQCVGVICLPDWEHSFGAGQIEVYLADRFGKQTLEYVESGDGRHCTLVQFDYNERMKRATPLQLTATERFQEV
jgi:hypothetical protein